jgi:adhesin/invasin
MNWEYVSGTVSGAASAGIDGILVTASATGAYVESACECNWTGALGGTSVYSTDGHYAFYVASNHPGKTVVTITAGGVTKTVDVYFKSSAAKTVTLAVNGGAATAQTGRSVAVTATVKDANGFLVPDRVVTFATSGLGALDSATATTDANGVATVHYLTGAAENGAVDFTATVKAHAEVQYLLVEQKTAVASSKVTVTFTRADGNVTHKKNTVTAHWSAAAGQKVIVVIDGYRRYTQVELADTANSFSKKLKKGRHTVNLYIGGVLVDSSKFTLKK